MSRLFGTRDRMVLVVVAAALALAAVGRLQADDAGPRPEGVSRQLVLAPDADIHRLGSYETDDSDFTSTSALGGQVEITDQRGFSGGRSVLTSARSPDGFAYARVQEEVAWDEGDEVWYGAAIYLERGFNDAQGVGSVDILRWDNWAEDREYTDHGGVTVLSDGTLALFREQRGSEPWTVLLGPYSVPEGRWVWLEVRQRFSSEAGSAINELWMDGRQLGANTEANHFGQTITRHRVGIVATPDPQPGELRLYLDQPAIAGSGPIMRLE